MPQLPNSDATCMRGGWFPEEFLCWVGISRNYLLNKDTYPRFEYEDGEEMDLNAFIRTADPRKVKIVERARVENEIPIVTVAKHRTVTLLPTSVPRTSGELSASVEREFAGDASVGDGVDQGVDSVVGGDYAGTSVPVTEPVVADIPRPKRSKKKRVVYDSEGLPVASHPPKKLRADYGDVGGSATGGKSLSALNRLLETSRLSVEQGVPTLPTLPFITSSVTASPLEEGGDRTDSVTGKISSAGPEVDSHWPVNLKRRISTLSLFTEGLEVVLTLGVSERRGFRRQFRGVYVPEVDGVTKGTVVEWRMSNCLLSFNVSAARNLSLTLGCSDACGVYIFWEKRKWKSLAEERNVLWRQAKDREIEDLKSQVFIGQGGYRELTPGAEVCFRPMIATSFLCRKLHFFTAKCGGTLVLVISGKDQELSELGASSSSLRSENQSEAGGTFLPRTSFEVETYEGVLASWKDFRQSKGHLRTSRMASRILMFTRLVACAFRRVFHPRHLLNVLAGRRWAANPRGERRDARGPDAGIEQDALADVLADLEALYSLCGG
ncbi:hypothetical protein Tco_0742387 [Tanacetum coccineum]